MKKLIMALGIVVIALTGFFLYVFVDFSGERYGQGEAGKLDAAAFAASFEGNEAEANQRFLGKIVELTGVVDRIVNEDEPYTILLKGTESAMVQCTFLSRPSKLSPGTNVTVRGVCSGYLMDVVLKDCEMIN